MKTDSYPRFLKCPLYQECVVSDLDKRPLNHSNGVKPPTPLAKSTIQLNSIEGNNKLDKKVINLNN